MIAAQIPPLSEIIDDSIFGAITLEGVTYLVAALVIGFVVSTIVDAGIRRTTQALREGSWRRALLDSTHGPMRWLVMIAFAWIGGVMFVGDDVDTISTAERNVLVCCQLPFILWMGLRGIDNVAKIWERKAEATETTFDDQIVPIGRTILKVVWIIGGIVSAAETLDLPISSILAGFGIGGAAIAFGSKDTIANLFGSIVIFVDRPFQIGDWVEIGAQEGTVETVGLRVTRIRTFSNSLITVPNSQLTTSAINNWSKMQKRRIKLNIGLTYNTSPKQMRLAVEALRKVLREDERISQEYWLVNFTDFGPSSLDIFVYCFTLTTKWDEYLTVRQDVMLKFMEEVEDLGLEFAFPTQTIQLDGASPDSVAQMAMSRGGMQNNP